MLGIILIIIGIIVLILGVAYFANKKVWVGLGIIILIIGAYFLFFATSVEDNGDSLIPGEGPDLVDFDQPINDIELISLYGFVENYYECGPEETCIEILGDDGAVTVKTMAEIDLEGVIDIDAFGYFEGSTFIAEDIIIITTMEDIS